MEIDIPKIDLRNEVLEYTKSLKVPGTECEFKLSASSNATIYGSLFALFIKDLFKDTENFSEAVRNSWIQYIQSFQDPETGYFFARDVDKPKSLRNKYQLTAFCLSALRILKSNPEYNLNFVYKEFPTNNSIRNYLFRNGCHEGRPGSGNFAMFLGIFLTYEYEKTGNKDLLDKINTWFEFHNETQNPKTGFWGIGIDHDYYEGFQNALHQFIIYKYHNRPYPNIQKAIKRIKILRDNEGLFNKTPGGFGCYEYDALEYIVHYFSKNKADEQLKKILLKSMNGILSLQKADGGFPLMDDIKYDLWGFLRYSRFFLSCNNPQILLYRLKIYLKSTIRKFHKQRTYYNWSNEGTRTTESNLWDTWLRCLSIALISNILKLDTANLFRFHKFIGIGYN
ncbi:MAG: hypothetical protein GF353_03360 [Candidatus Lokiarchaeota archaeon]|nr:hypothetical protein [Candidatus Lokiarchaeota archaeon]